MKFRFRGFSYDADVSDCSGLRGDICRPGQRRTAADPAGRYTAVRQKQGIAVVVAVSSVQGWPAARRTARPAIFKSDQVGAAELRHKYSFPILTALPRPEGDSLVLIRAKTVQGFK